MESEKPEESLTEGTWARYELERSIAIWAAQDDEYSHESRDIDPDSMRCPLSSVVMRAVREVLQAGQTPSLITVGNWLAGYKTDPSMRARFFAEVLKVEIQTIGHYRQRVDQLRDLVLRDKLVRLASQMKMMAQDLHFPAQEMREKIPGMVADVLARAGKSEVYREDECAMQVVEQMDQEEADLEKGIVHQIEFGFDNIDTVHGPTKPGELIMITANSGEGKSSIGLQIARYTSEFGKTYIWSGEMSRQELVIRAACSELGMEKSQITRGDMFRFKEEFAKNVFIDDDCSMGVEELCQSVRLFKLRNPDLRVLLVDYLGLLVDRAGADRNYYLDAAARSMKILAKTLGIVVILLHQINNDTVKRDDKRPVDSDVQGSTGIKNHLDRLFMMFRPSRYYKNEPEDLIEVWTRKHRNGPSDVCHKFRFTKKYSKLFALESSKAKASREEREAREEAPPVLNGFNPEGINFEEMDF